MRGESLPISYTIISSLGLDAAPSQSQYEKKKLQTPRRTGLQPQTLQKKNKPCPAHWSNNVIVYGPHTKSEILQGRQASKRRPLEPVPENEPKENRQDEKTDKTTPRFENDVTFDPLKKSATMTTSARDDISVDSRSAVNQVKAAIDGIWSTTLELEKLYLYE